MNKKQLRESIMSGVERAFRTDKALNEGFSTWREANVPKFNVTDFFGASRQFLTVTLGLLKTGQMSSIRFSIYQQESNSYSVIFEAIDKTTPESAIMDITKRVTELKRDLGEDGFVAAMNKTAFILKVPVKSHLWKYMESTIDVASNRINGLEFIKFNRPGVNTEEVKLFITSKELMENIDTIIEYFS